eukprot:3470693-Amphidinium_carterae.2
MEAQSLFDLYFWFLSKHGVQSPSLAGCASVTPSSYFYCQNQRNMAEHDDTYMNTSSMSHHHEMTPIVHTF